MSSQKIENYKEDKPGLWLIHEPEAPLRAVCDIIAVHGLSGGPFSTWTHAQNQKVWLRDFLPAVVQNHKNRTSARIWTFGYNANVFSSPAVAGISDFTRSFLGHLVVEGIDVEQNKIIFVVHSLGGVLVKSALIDAGRHGSQHKWLLNATAGIVFLGTPHQGSKIANKGAYISNIAKYTGLVKPNSQVLDSLKQNSGDLFDKAEQFRDVCHEIQLWSFYEILPISSMKMIVVDKTSTFIGVTGERIYPLNADHRSICKFEGLDDQNFRFVQTSIVKIMEKITSFGETASITELGGINQQTRSRGYGGFAQTGLVNRNSPYSSPPPQGWGNYQYPSVSNHEDNHLESSSSDFESRPATSTSQASFEAENSYRQDPWQAIPRSRRSPISSESDGFPTSQRGPSGQIQPPNCAWSLPDHYGPQKQNFPSMQSLPSRSSRNGHFNANDPPYVDPSSSTHPLSAGQLQETSQSANSPSGWKSVPPSEPAAWYCDVCTKGHFNNDARFHCTICQDYDLCVQCHMNGRSNKNHRTSHKLLSITTRRTVQVDAITPCHDNVTPQFSPPRTQENWTEEGENRWLHLRKLPSHARFIVRRLPSGAYLIYLIIRIKFSDHINMATFKRAKEIGLGTLKITLGSPLSISTFLNESRTEDATLPQQLFGFDRSLSVKLKIPDDITNPIQPWDLVCDLSTITTYIGMESGTNPANAILGVLLQWSEVLEFQANDNPIIMITLSEIIMDALLEYDEPPPLPPPLPIPTIAAASSARQQVTVANVDGDDDDDDDDHDRVTMEELIDAAKWLEDNDRLVTSDNLLSVIAATRQVQTEIQTAILLRQMQQVRERQRREQELRQQQVQAAGNLLLLSWLLSD